MGLLKTAATVAVASSVHGRVQRRQQARWAGQEQQNATAWQAQQPPPQQPPPQQSPQPPAPASPDDIAGRLANITKLGELLNAGLLTQAEFDQQKARILSS
jgi:hemolysin activation/secretion protein